jgi:hypothetical protein
LEKYNRSIQTNGCQCYVYIDNMSDWIIFGVVTPAPSTHARTPVWRNWNISLDRTRNTSSMVSVFVG